MICGKSVLAIIPARGGSKGIPKKNIYEAAGKPLIAWTIEEARKSTYIDRLILSSDDDEIMAAGVRYGCEVPFRRPPELARDDTPGSAPVLHAINMLPGYDYVVLLQPTSPLRTAEDIDACLALCERHSAASCVSVVEAEENPYWMFRVGEKDRMVSLFPGLPLHARRQDLPKVYELNGAIYVSAVDQMLRHETFLTDDTVMYVMPRDRSIDIDTMEEMAAFEQTAGKANRDAKGE
jgi:CMP-N,N'-diacetyllegionaminic acid synthase